jgi:hypothetical protein
MVDGAQKMVKMYDSLMKSGNFTARQNKSETDGIDSFAEFVELCEKEGFIPRYYTDKPQDKVDETILDLKQYTRNLIVDEMNLGSLIEGAVKKMAIEEAKEEDEDVEIDEELTLDRIEELKDADIEDFLDFEQDEAEATEDLIDKLKEASKI